MRLALYLSAIALLCVCIDSPVSAQPATTTLIRNALIIDGRGTPSRRGDVRIRGDRIVAIGTLTPAAEDRVVDAKGLALAPGFIDTHSHHDRELFDARDATAMVSQGITTIVVGQDGGGMNLRTLFNQLTAEPVAVNVASYVGHGAVRRAVLGNDFRRHATPAELARMQALVRADMAAGALGLSSGLEYDPGIYSAPDEVLALAKVAADAGGRYISHIRSEDRDFWQALDELITIGRVNRMPVQVSHIKLGMLDLWGKADSVVRVLNRARAEGVNVTADIYPYLHWSSNLGVFYPKRNFADSAETAFVLSHVTAANDIILSRVAGHPEYRGQTLAQVAAARGRSAARTMMDLLAEPNGSGIGVVAKGMDDADVGTLMQWSFTNICSDGTSSGLHPRGFGSFPKVVGPYVRDRKLFSLEEAVRKMTSLAAENVGIRERGVIATGAFADLVLFDPATVGDRASFEAPQALAVGIQQVWVNGVSVFVGGATTKQYPGRAVRRAGVSAQTPSPVEAVQQVDGPPLAKTGSFQRHTNFPSKHVAARTIEVWLPPGYSGGDARYPVVYMHDGQNVFDPATAFGGIDWGVDETMTRLIAEQRIKPAIVVAIWNTSLRFQEYMPRKAMQSDSIIPTGRPSGESVPGPSRSDAYLRFLGSELKPFIDRSYRTKPQRENTFLMGSSMGGLISLYAVTELPGLFGGAACLSTHWPAGGGGMVDYLRTSIPKPGDHRFYFDHGSATLDSLYAPYQSRVDALFRDAGYRDDRRFVNRVFNGAEHSERAWRVRVDGPLEFLLRR